MLGAWGGFCEFAVEVICNDDSTQMSLGVGRLNVVNRSRLMDLLMEEQCADRGALANPVGDQGSEMVATAMDLSIRSIFRSPFESRIQIYPRSYRLLGTFYFSNEKKVRWRSRKRERNERS